MAWRATSLGPKPSLFVFFVCSVFFVVFLFFVFLCFFFPFFASRWKDLFHPLKKGILCIIFELSPFSFVLSLFWPPTFSISLSLPLSCYVLSFFLLVFLFCFLLVPCFCLFLSYFFLLCFCFMKGTTSKYSITKFFFINPFSFLGFSVLFSLSNPFFLIFAFFLILSYVFCSTSMFLVSKTNKSKKTTLSFGQEGGCNKTFFLWTCVLQNVKSYRFCLALFWQTFLVDVQKHYKIGTFQHIFKKQTKAKHDHF